MLKKTQTISAGLVIFLTAQANAEPSFLLRRDFGFEGPRTSFDVVIEDFNHDSIPDVAIVNADLGDSGGVTVLIGRGDGSFDFHGKIAEYPIPDGAFAIATGDFNGDGNIDLAVTTRSGSGIQLLLGSGLGEFRRGAVIPAGFRPGSIAAADLNRDGIVDLLVSNGPFSGSISVLLGNGDGTFQDPRPFSVGRFPGFLVVADFNRDDIPDVAVTVFDEQSHPEIDVLLGQGDGSFGPAQIVDPGTSHGNLAVADFNGDGIPDLVATTADGFEILLGNGDGTFGAPLTRSLSLRTNRVAAADLDGDGVVDLVISNTIQLPISEQPVLITVLRGNGDGTFGEERRLQTGNKPSVVAIRDLNGDNQPDLVVANSGSFTVSILLNNSNPLR